MRFRIAIAALSLLMSVGLSAQQPDTEKLFQSELRAKNEHVTSIECEFTQVREVSLLANRVSKDGTFYFLKPNNMLLSFDDGEYIKMTTEWFEMKTGENVTTTKVSSNPMLRNLSSILSACVVGDFDKMSSGFAVGYSESATEWIITLTPQRGKAASKISRIVITFDKSDMSLNILKMEEKSGDYTEYSFRNKQFNGEIDSQLFKGGSTN